MQRAAEVSVFIMAALAVVIITACAVNVSWKVHPLAGVLAAVVIVSHVYIYINEKMRNRNEE